MWRALSGDAEVEGRLIWIPLIFDLWANLKCLEIFDEDLLHVPWHAFSQDTVAGEISEVTMFEVENWEESGFRQPPQLFRRSLGWRFQGFFRRGQL